jgi:hypothetical protein
MAERRGFTRRRSDPTQAYALQPVRSRRARWCALFAWTVATAAAGAGGAWWGLPRDAKAPCPVVPRDALQTELADARLKLEQERAARAAVQKSADSAQTELAKLRADLLFLRGQRGAH